MQKAEDKFRAVYVFSGFQFQGGGDALDVFGEAGVVEVWDVQGSERLTTLRGHSDEVYAVEFAPDGLTLATGGRSSRARLAAGELRLYKKRHRRQYPPAVGRQL